MGTIDALPSDEVRMHLVGDAMRRHWLSILFIALLMTTVAFAYTHAGTTSYTAYSRVLVRPIPGNALSDDVTSSTGQVTVAMQTEASLISSPAVTEIANAELDDDVTPGSAAVVATVPENTEIVQVAFTAGSARDAQRGAQAFAAAFLQYRQDLAQSSIDYQSDSLQRQARSAEASLEEAAHMASSANPPPDAASQVQLYASRLAALQSSLSQLQTLDVRPGSLVTPARLPASPIGVSPLVLLLAAGLVGLGGGVAMAIWRERRDDRVRSGSQPTLHGVPVVARLPQRARARAITDLTIGHTTIEAYRQAAIGTLAGTSRPAVLVVSAVDDLTRSGDVAVNVGISLRQAGHQVVFVDAAGEGVSTGHLLGLPPGPGLRDVLHGAIGVDAALREVHGMRVLGAGTRQDPGRDLVSGVEMADLLEKLRGETEFVVVAAPPATTSTGTAMAVAGDSLLVVVTERRSTNQDLAEVVQRCRQLGVDIRGLLIAQPTSRSHEGTHSSPSGLQPDLEEHLRIIFPTPLTLSVPRRLTRSRPTDYLLMPSARHPKLVVPARPRRATVASIRQYRPATSTADRLRRFAAVLAVRTGLSALVFGRVRVTAPPGERVGDLVDHLSEVLGRSVSFGLHLGPRRAVRKPVLQLIGRDGHTVAFAKVGATRFTRELVRHEADAIERLAGKSFGYLVLPTVLDHARWHGHELLVLAPLSGTRAAQVDPTILGKAMNELARSGLTRTAALGTSRYWRELDQRLESLPESPTRRRLRTAVDAVSAAAAGRRLEFGSWHGDWTPWNMTTDGECALVWDWEKFDTGVPIGFDAVHCAVQGLVVLSGMSPAAAFEQVRGRATTLLAPFQLSAESANLIVSLYAIEISIRYLHDGETEAGTTPMTRVAEWLPTALDVDLAVET